MAQHERGTAYYHLPGLFEFYELYRVFLPLFREHREYFYDWCEIGSVYGAPAGIMAMRMGSSISPISAHSSITPAAAGTNNSGKMPVR